MSFTKWLRSNSEHYLLQDAQLRMARQLGFNEPQKPHGLKNRFWRQVFVPVYRKVPTVIRTRLIAAIPGSHRRDWPAPDYSPKKPVV
jgi:hypothetical protein